MKNGPAIKWSNIRIKVGVAAMRMDVLSQGDGTEWEDQWIPDRLGNPQYITEKKVHKWHDKEWSERSDQT